MTGIVTNIYGRYVRFLMLAAISLAAFQANANMKYQDYYPLKDTEDMLVYVWGFGKGLTWSNTMLENSGRRGLYCVSQSFDISAQNLTEVISREAAYYDDTQLQQVTVEQLLVTGMIRNFPCQGGGRQ